MFFKTGSEWVSEWVSESVSDKGTYRAVRWQLKIWTVPLILQFNICFRVWLPKYEISISWQDSTFVSEGCLCTFAQGKRHEDENDRRFGGTFIWSATYMQGLPCNCNHYHPLSKTSFIWVSFCRAGKIIVSHHFFFKSRAFVWPNRKRSTWVFNWSRLNGHCRF